MKVAKAKAKVKKEKKSPGNRALGKSLKLGVQATWASVFAQNEKSPKASKLTDAEITKFMNKEFPGRKSKVFERVQHVRGAYNKGFLTQGKKPGAKSARWDPEKTKKAS